MGYWRGTIRTKTILCVSLTGLSVPFAPGPSNAEAPPAMLTEHSSLEDMPVALYGSRLAQSVLIGLAPIARTHPYRIVQVGFEIGSWMLDLDFKIGALALSIIKIDLQGALPGTFDNEGMRVEGRGNVMARDRIGRFDSHG